MVVESLKVAEKMAKENVDIEVVDPRTIVPLDKGTIINSVKKTGRVIIVDEGCKTAGVGAELSALIMEEAFDYLDAPVKRVASLDVPVPFSPPLEKAQMPVYEDIEEAVRSLL
jgi:pyruvate/2-oxoglutarate/acetoin dehydrogenase E1 component